METQIIKIDPKEYGLEEKQVSEIEKAFLPKIAERDVLAEIYKQLLTKELTEQTCKEAGELRNKLVKVRTGIASIHKTQKAFYLAAGRFVDAWKNKETLPVEQMEDQLEKIEKHFILIEQERIANLEKERKELLLQYTEIIPASLGVMEQAVFDAFLISQKNAYEERIEAEKKAEQERIAKEKAEAEERERIKKENERLKAEAEERERKAAQERAKAEADRKAIEEKARKEREEADRKLKAEQEFARIAAEKAAQERAKLEAELRAKQEEEERRIKAVREEAEAQRKAKEEAERKAKNAPDREKLLNIVSQIEAIILPDVTSIEAKEVLKNVKVLLTKVNTYISEKTANI